MESTVKKNLQILRAWGISAPLIERYAADSTAVLPQVLETVQTQIKERDLFAYPASFEGGSSLLGFPAPARRAWPSCEQTLRDFKVDGIMMLLPLFWQLASALHGAARGVQIPLFINQPDNLPLAQAALQRAEIDTVVSTPEHAARLVARQQEAGAAEPRLWILLRRVGEEQWVVPKSLRGAGGAVAQEVHLFPGIALLTQCPALIQNASPHFHPTDEYYWEYAEDGARITSRCDPLPLIRYRLPSSLRQQEAPCSCGKTLLTCV